MIPGFDRIVEDRIQKALREGAFDDLPGSGKPLNLTDDSHIPEDLRLAYKILKNADFLPPEIEIKKEIRMTEDLLARAEDATARYRIIKKLNFLILKLNTTRERPVELEMPQKYYDRGADRMATRRPD